jgi:hypothetical protein
MGHCTKRLCLAIGVGSLLLIMNAIVVMWVRREILTAYV